MSINVTNNKELYKLLSSSIESAISSIPPSIARDDIIIANVMNLTADEVDGLFLFSYVNQVCELLQVNQNNLIKIHKSNEQQQQQQQQQQNLNDNGNKISNVDNTATLQNQASQDSKEILFLENHKEEDLEVGFNNIMLNNDRITDNEEILSLVSNRENEQLEDSVYHKLPLWNNCICLLSHINYMLSSSSSLMTTTQLRYHNDLLMVVIHCLKMIQQEQQQMNSNEGTGYVEIAIGNCFKWIRTSLSHHQYRHEYHQAQHREQQDQQTQNILDNNDRSWHDLQQEEKRMIDLLNESIPYIINYMKQYLTVYHIQRIGFDIIILMMKYQDYVHNDHDFIFRTQLISNFSTIDIVLSSVLYHGDNHMYLSYKGTMFMELAQQEIISHATSSSSSNVPIPLTPNIMNNDRTIYNDVNTNIRNHVNHIDVAYAFGGVSRMNRIADYNPEPIQSLWSNMGMIVRGGGTGRW